jgi:hypothetical protein
MRFDYAVEIYISNRKHFQYSTLLPNLMLSQIETLPIYMDLLPKLFVTRENAAHGGGAPRCS